MQAIRDLAAATPDSRNRAVDAYRAVAIVLVVLGHWMGAAVWVDGGSLRFTNVLALEPWTHWATWVVQVIPVFFIVGGYANWRSFRTAQRDGNPAVDWLAGRFRRLVTPLVPFFAVVTILTLAVLAAGVEEGIVHSGAWNALVPLWFLAVYLMAIAAVPITTRLWDRYGWWTVAGGAAAAVAIDAIRASANADWFGWANFAVVWLTVHQIGFAWASERRRPTRRWMLGWFLAALVTLILMTRYGPYPVSMVAVPRAPDNNTFPPTAAMLVMAAVQYPLLRLLELGASRVMARTRAWIAVVGLHTVMMTVYIWHVAALALVVLAGYAMGWGFALKPFTAAWWLTRPIWILVLTASLAVLVAVFGRFEHAVRPVTEMSPVRLAAGGLAIVGTIGATATGSIVTESGTFRWWVLGLFAFGVLALGAWPARRSPARGRI